MLSTALTIVILFFMIHPDMEYQPLTKAYLEGLTNRELIKLADMYGIDIPPDLDRIFIIRELLDFEMEYEQAPEDSSPMMLQEGSEVPESVPIPKHYNITYLDVLVRDSLWAFAFWEISSHDKGLYGKSADFNGFFLRIISEDGAPGDEMPYIIPVGDTDTSWYVSFSSGSGLYRIELCAAKTENDVVLASSVPFRLPANFVVPKSGQDFSESTTLFTLAGGDKMKILCNNDRASRLHHNEGI